MRASVSCEHAGASQDPAGGHFGFFRSRAGSLAVVYQWSQYLLTQSVYSHMRSGFPAGAVSIPAGTVRGGGGGGEVGTSYARIACGQKSSSNNNKREGQRERARARAAAAALPW